jgi:diguanylate cyclase (GGDEF)-like protein
MFRRARTDNDPPPDEPVAAALDDGALDTVAAILRALADASRRDPRTGEELEAWARHVLLLEPPPGWPGDPPARRHWGGVRGTAVRCIRDEVADREKGMGDLQDVIWAMVENVSRAMADEVRQDRTTAECLERLRAAAVSPPEELRQQALEAVGALGQILESKRERQKELAGSLGARIQALSSELEEVRREAELDALTQLANRGVFDRELARTVYMRALVDEPVCLILADLDRFKEINDGHGHAAGDEALRTVARELSRDFPRRSDVVARYGGDEFAVILRHANEEDASRLANRFLFRLRDQLLRSPAGSFTLTTSIGIAEVNAGMTPEEVLAAADAALYAAKAAGRDRATTASQAPARATAA